MKYHTIYKITNNINNKIYIGLHSTDNIKDNYMGSGIFIKKAIKKYGIENFTKEILHIFSNKQEMINKEIELVDLPFIKEGKTYNMVLGGYGLGRFSEKRRKEIFDKISKTLKEKDSTESIKKRKDTLLKNDENAFKKIGIKSGETQKRNYMSGKTVPKIKYEKLNIYNKENDILFSFKLSDMLDICNNNNLPHRSLIKSYHNNGTPLYIYQPPRVKEYLKYKGWYCLCEVDERINIEKYMEIYYDKKKETSEIMRKKDLFKSCRYIPKGNNYVIYDNNNNVKFEIFGNIKKELKKMKLPYSLYLTILNDKRMKTGEYKDWYIKKKRMD